MDRLENLKNIIMYLMADEHVSYQNGAPVSMNLRCDDTFVEDSHWHRQAKRFNDFVYKASDKSLLLLEFGVGFNTPGIIRFP
ncbi:MAG: hypothetical protein ACOCOS_08895, partial [Prevotella sp.]